VLLTVAPETAAKGEKGGGQDESQNADFQRDGTSFFCVCRLQLEPQCLNLGKLAIVDLLGSAWTGRPIECKGGSPHRSTSS